MTGPERDDLTTRYFRGEASREAVLTAHEPLIGKVFRACFRGWRGGRRVVPSSLAEVGDLVQAGWIGLNTALDRFDPERGYRFSTYAAWWIKREIFREVGNLEAVQIPDWLRPTAFKLAISRRPLTAKQADQVAACPDATAAGVAAYGLADPERRLRGRALVALRDPDPGPAAAVTAADVGMAVRAAVAELPPPERDAVVGYFGLDGEPPRTFKAMAVPLGLTPGGVQSRKTRALKTLRRRLESVA